MINSTIFQSNTAIYNKITKTRPYKYKPPPCVTKKTAIGASIPSRLRRDLARSLVRSDRKKQPAVHAMVYRPKRKMTETQPSSFKLLIRKGKADQTVKQIYVLFYRIFGKVLPSFIRVLRFVAFGNQFVTI